MKVTRPKRKVVTRKLQTKQALGGQKLKRQMLRVNPDYYKEVGDLGGEATKKKMLAKDPEYYRKLAAKRTHYGGGRPKKVKVDSPKKNSPRPR